MARAKLNIEVEDSNGIRVIHLSGPLDSQTYDEFKEFMNPIISQSRVRIVLDCQNLTYVNSRAWTLLIHYQRSVKTGLSFFGIAALRPRILKGIELLRLDKLMQWYPTIDDAMQIAIAI